uniref:Uncharacterized protein n=1 Tax=Rhizophora mucronata TaxID=61149 RepID=A0A2P2JGU3_RHIMU
MMPTILLFLELYTICAVTLCQFGDWFTLIHEILMCVLIKFS